MEDAALQSISIADNTNEATNVDDVDIIPVIGAVICQELGIETDEVEVDTDLRESGLNSLSALMITVRLVEEYGIDLGPGTLKENYSLCRLRKALHRKNLDVQPPQQENPPAETPPLVSDASITETASSSEMQPAAVQASLPMVTFAPLVTIIPPECPATRVMAIIAEEMNIDEAEFAESVEWTSFGLDSIMSLTICGRLREELEMDLESSVFADYDSVGAFKSYLSEMQSSP